MSKPIGPREQQLRDMREGQFERTRRKEREAAESLRERIASIPARKVRPEKKKRR